MLQKTERAGGAVTWTFYWLAAALILAQSVPIEGETGRPPLPEASYAEAAGSGAAVYRIVPEQSLILIRVGRGGIMRWLGHDHAVASEDIEGLVEMNDDPAASRAHIVLPVRNLIVDRREYRERLELDTTPSADAVAKTYTNMLKVLEPQLFPWVEARARFVTAEGPSITLAVTMTLHGSTAEYLLPVRLEVDAERLVVSGQATIKHGDFGITPFAAAGGLLRVADELIIDFRLVGRAVQNP